MLDLKQRVKRLLFQILGKDPEAVVVIVLSGRPELAAAMADEVKGLIPERRHFIVEEAVSPWKLRRRFRPFRIGITAVLFDGDPAFRAMRWAAFLLAPGKVLAYNARGERHHLRLRSPIASLLFLGGTPLDRIYIRPWWLFPWKRDRSVVPANYRIFEGRPLVSTRPRVAVLSPYFPYPLAHGGAVRIFNLLREVSREFDVFLFAFAENDASEETAPVLQFCSQLILIPKPRYREPRWSSLLPPEVKEFDTPVLRPLIAGICRLHGIRLIQVEYTQLAAYKGDVLVEHDVTYDLYSQIQRREKSFTASWDLWRWRRFETRAIRRYRRVVVMSEKDARMLAANNVEVIANGVDLDRFQPVPEQEGQRLLFIGSFRHFPNVVAFRFLVEQVWPILAAQLPQVTLTVVSGPDRMLHWRNYAGSSVFPPVERMRLLEFVPDVRPLYVETNLVLVPTLVSAGTNVKVLEAMAMERAVVSTTSGCAGLGLEHGRSVWVADDAPSFAAGVARLISDSTLRSEIAKQARLIAERDFDWRGLGRQQRRLWRELLGSAVSVRTAVAGDLACIAEIQTQSPEAAQWEPASYLEYDCRVAVMDGHIAGFVVLRQTSADEREILNLAVAPDFRRHGIATALIAGEKQNGAHLFLEVRESNEPARKLYHCLGFREIGLRPEYYTNPTESAIVMRF